MTPNKTVATTTTGAAAMSSLSSSSEQEWPIELYRCTESDGWQKQVPILLAPPPSGTTTTTNSGTSRQPRATSTTTAFLLKVIPRKDCIVIPALRQKITLSAASAAVAAAAVAAATATATAAVIAKDGILSQGKVSADDENGILKTSTTTPVIHNDNNSSHPMDKDDKSFLVRRGDRILIVSRRRTRAMLLQFRSLEACLAFSDCFLRLNPPPAATPLAITRTTTLAGITSTTTTTNRNSAVARAATSRRSVAVGQQDATHHQEVGWYMARLMHDAEFLQLVHCMETAIAQTPDGAKMLQALETRDLTLSSSSSRTATTSSSSLPLSFLLE
jgi:hypothetical protein